MIDRPILEIVMSLVVILLSIALHEYAHAKTADASGDPTPRMMGRVTLNPLVHLDPMGTIFIMFTVLSGFGIGWGKPVMVQPHKMRNPRWDHFYSVLAGPMMNLMLAVIAAIIFRAIQMAGVPLTDTVFLFFILAISINVGLFCFNLIPLGPLDGHWLVGAFLKEPGRSAWYQFNRGPGTMILLLIIILGASPELNVLDRVLWPIVERIVMFLIGMS